MSSSEQPDSAKTAPEPGEHGEAAETDADPQTDAQSTVTIEGDEANAASEAEPDPLQAECDALKDQLLRLRAEFDNFRKRTARENERFRNSANAALIRDLLPVLDNLERALGYKDDTSGSLTEGMEMVRKQMLELFERTGLKVIPAQGQPFDPRLHEAIAQVNSDDIPQDRIVDEYLRGYTLNDEVLRPSKVTVSGGAAENENANTENEA